MDKFIIKGRNRLKGQVRISGAKNAALPILTSCILTDKPIKIKNLPGLKDIKTMLKLLINLGANYTVNRDEITLNCSKIKKFIAPYDLVKTMRASFLVAGPLLGRYKRAEVALPGGCAIGARPVNLHLKGFEKLGAKIDIKDGVVILNTKQLVGNKIYLDTPSVGATENLLTAGVLAKGETVIENAAKEPEVVDLANFLKALGAKIYGEGTEKIYIQGVDSLNSAKYSIIPDRIETGTFIIAAAITNGHIIIKNTDAHLLDSVISKLRETGLEIIVREKQREIEVKSDKNLQPANVTTMPYPGFPTDMQAQYMALMAIVEGTSLITETVFENRFMHVAELRRFGADITIDGHTAVVKGIKKLKAAPVMATDLRASAALVLAGLAAEGKTVIDRIYHLDRGYENLEKKLRKLGANVKRVRRL